MPRARRRGKEEPDERPQKASSAAGSGLDQTPAGLGSANATLGGLVPAMPIHHVDLAVGDVERSLAFYRALLVPLGWTAELRYPTYRGTEEVVYLQEPATRAGIGLRPADGGEYRYHSV